MGTRGVINIYEGKNGEEHLASLYSQFDSYPTGLGEDILKIVGNKQVVNGYNSDNKGIVFNGMGCFGVTLIKEMKEDTGGIYLTPELKEIGDSWVEWIYNIYLKEEMVKKEVERTLMIEIKLDDKTEYNGTMKDFNPIALENKINEVIAE